MVAARYLFDLNTRRLGVTNQLRVFARLIVEHGDCMSFDYFKPVKNERLAEKIAMQESDSPPIAST